MLEAGYPCRDVYADKGYVDGEREQWLKARGWCMPIPPIPRKGRAGKPLSDGQARRNRRLVKSRAHVAPIYAGSGVEGRRGAALDRPGPGDAASA